jgi:hypothetical protein
MAVSAAIKFVQGANVGVPGISLIYNPATGHTVVASNGDDSNVIRWTWKMLATPGASAVPIGIISDGSFPTATFTWDVSGCYHLELVTTDINGNQAKDRRVFGVTETTGRLIPPFDAEAPAMNFGGQLKGWSPYLEAYLKAVDAGGGGGSTNPQTAGGHTFGVLSGIDNTGLGVFLTYPSLANLVFPDTSSISLVLDVTASRTDANGMGRTRWLYNCHTHGGALTIDTSQQITPDGMGLNTIGDAAAFASFVVTPAALTFRMHGVAVGGSNITFSAAVDWVATAGF